MWTVKPRQRKTKDPCEICRLHRDRCLCAEIPRLTIDTRLLLVIHHRELKRTTNTGMLATHALTNSRVVIRGKPDHNEDSHLGDDHHHLLLFPYGDAVTLSRQFASTINKPVQLIVPDGNWRQASKVRARCASLRNITCVQLPTQQIPAHRLRREPMTNGQSTLEAIAYALEYFEDPAVAQSLRALYALKLRRTLLGRGVLPGPGP